ncbi:phycobilisome protein [Gloeocapsopsis sp. IPPAS B-1203]|uniref:phycobilisome protein n=1 Tax=Gloeocapsopsis sp. IPPAS B-1203 TaxID=2049454 RepID=UPI000C1934E0|nr:phycobilisome protein [Gloeocapsopsis sp. IPPAS B-1203]PIG94691.1 phycobilisome protein [Gloeocapsopsis sp. IPPAS B-1203]
MLTQLSRLSVEADGRYATAEELQFINNYFQTFDWRLSAYEKITKAEAEILARTEAKMRDIDPSLFQNASGDFTPTWRKDIIQLLTFATATLLVDDQERLREGMLIWHATIAKSYKFERTCKITFEVMPEVVKEFLTSEEAALFNPILTLNQIVLG